MNKIHASRLMAEVGRPAGLIGLDLDQGVLGVRRDLSLAGVRSGNASPLHRDMRDSVLVEWLADARESERSIEFFEMSLRIQLDRRAGIAPPRFG